MDAILKEHFSTRQKCNKELVAIISDFVNECPDWRFHQILQNIGITTRSGGDMFYEESSETLERVLSHFEVSEKS